MDLSPLREDWPDTTQGDTFPAFRITETEAEVDLTRVRCMVKATPTSTAVVTLDSASSGVTLTNTTAREWDITVGPISAATTANIAAGKYQYDLEFTTADGVVRTEFRGLWRILPQITA